jgi:VanZ family protein
MTQGQKRLRLCTALILVNLCVIWGNSLLPGEISGRISDLVRDGLRLLLELLGLSGGDSGPGGGLLRKLAHFTEFACLGGLFAWYFSLRKMPRLLALGGGFLSACVDETIQRFVPDRGPSVFDVALDTAGVVFGILLYICIFTIPRKK